MIGLYQLDGKWPNLALMKIGAYLRNRGEQVQRIGALEQTICETVYASKIFQFTDRSYVREDAIRGGTGWPDWKGLPNLDDEIEHTYPAYDMWNCTWAMGFLTRGCVRHCPFCVVPDKEGRIRHHSHLSEWRNGQKYLRLLDANLTAHPDAVGYLEELSASGAYVDFSQGLDSRLITPEFCEAIKKVKLWGDVHTAWDLPEAEDRVLPGMRMLRDALPKDSLTAYVLIGYNTTPEQDLYRVMKLKEEGIKPFVMAYDKTNRYQKDFARWVNRKAIFETVKWEDYRGRKR